MNRRKKISRKYLYIFECRTPHGFTYESFGNSLDEIPDNCTGAFWVNIEKR